MRKLFVVLLIVGLFISLSAKAVSEKEALNVIKVLLNNHPKLTNKVLSPTKIISIKQDDKILAFAKEFSNSGFIVISADTDVKTLIIYSENSKLNLEEDENNVFLSFLKQDINKRLELLPNLAKVKEKNNSRWNQYLNATDQAGVISLANIPELTVRTEVSPLLNGIVWDQSDVGDVLVWNYYTPSNMVCGCVATSMAQVMKYYSWPTIGTGSHSYTDTNGSGETLSANFGETTYPWDLTLDEYFSSSSLASRQAAGLVASDCGISVNMRYGSSSSANSLAISKAFKNYFRYNAEYFWWENDEDEVAGTIFLNQVQDNILNGMPIQMAITSSGGYGHAVIVDGFRDTSVENEYHVNFGWGGYNNGFYTFPVMDDTWDIIHGATMNTVPIPYVENDTVLSSAGSFSLNWENSDLSNAEFYKISEQTAANEATTFSDDFEAGEANWTLDEDFWNVTNYYSHNGNYSIRGYVPGTPYSGYLNLVSDFNVIDSNSSLEYYYKQNYLGDNKYEIQASTDGSFWETIYEHSGNDTGWELNSVSLDEYQGEKVSLRVFVAAYGSYYTGNSAGLFIDDLQISGCSQVTQPVELSDVTGTTVSYSGKADGTYFYSIRPEFNNQWWEWTKASPKASIKVVVGGISLDTPQNVNIVVASENRMLVTWDAVPNATSYKVYASDDPEAAFGDWELVGNDITATQGFFERNLEKKFFHVKAVM